MSLTVLDSSISPQVNGAAGAAQTNTASLPGAAGIKLTSLRCCRWNSS